MALATALCVTHGASTRQFTVNEALAQCFVSRDSLAEGMKDLKEQDECYWRLRRLDLAFEAESSLAADGPLFVGEVAEQVHFRLLPEAADVFSFACPKTARRLKSLYGKFESDRAFFLMALNRRKLAKRFEESDDVIRQIRIEEGRDPFMPRLLEANDTEASPDECSWRVGFRGDRSKKVLLLEMEGFPDVTLVNAKEAFNTFLSGKSGFKEGNWTVTPQELKPFGDRGREFAFFPTTLREGKQPVILKCKEKGEDATCRRLVNAYNVAVLSGGPIRLKYRPKLGWREILKKTVKARLRFAGRRRA